jgi:hypothetical protein
MRSIAGLPREISLGVFEVRLDYKSLSGSGINTSLFAIFNSWPAHRLMVFYDAIMASSSPIVNLLHDTGLVACQIRALVRGVHPNPLLGQSRGRIRPKHWSLRRLVLPASVSGQRRFRLHLSKKNIGNTMDAYINAYTSIPIPRINVPMICTHIRDTLFSNPVPFVPRLKMSLRVFNPLVAK